MLPTLDYKRILLAILLVIISIGLLFGIIWLIFLRQPVEQPSQNEPTAGSRGNLPDIGTGEPGGVISPGGTLPGSTGNEPIGGTNGQTGQELAQMSEVARGSLTKVYNLAEVPIDEVTLASSGFNYLSGEDSKFYRLSFDGNNRLPLATEAFPYVDRITWSADGAKAILEYPDGANIVYDFTKNRKVTLPTGAEGFSFDASGDNIAYKFIGSREEDNWLVVSDSQNIGAEAIEPLGDQGDKVEVAWSPAGQVVALYHDSIGLNREEVFFVGHKGENFKSMVVEGSNFSGKWSPDGKKILYHVINSVSDYNPVLWIADAAGENIGNNNFNLGIITWVDKCVFSGNNKVYCAVPIELKEGAGLYPELLADSADVFYEINLDTGLSKLIAFPVMSEELSEFQVKKLFISDDGSKLYFWDAFTQGLYYLRLK